MYSVLKSWRESGWYNSARLGLGRPRLIQTQSSLESSATHTLHILSLRVVVRRRSMESESSALENFHFPFKRLASCMPSVSWRNVIVDRQDKRLRKAA